MHSSRMRTAHLLILSHSIHQGMCVSQHALGRRCVSQHALGRGCVSQHALGIGGVCPRGSARGGGGGVVADL